jgi:hypothetical protein
MSPEFAFFWLAICSYNCGMVQFPAKKYSKSALYLCALAALFAGQCIVLAQLSGNGNFLVPLSDPQVSLGTPILTNGQVQLPLNGEPDVAYVIESSPDFVNWTPIATNNDLGVTRMITVDADAGHYYRASRAPRPLAIYAVAARGNVNLAGTGQTTDSFNSADSAFSTDGQYDKTKARTNGAVASTGGNVFLGNHTLGGDLFLGLTATLSLSNSFQVFGTIHTNQPITFPDVVLPNVSWLDAPLTGAVHDFTESGYYVVNDNSNLVVEAGVVAVLNVTTPYFGSVPQIHGGITNSGTAYIFLNGPTNAFINRNWASDASNQAKNLCIFGMPALVSLTGPNMSSTNFAGVIYAPSAAITLNGGGISSGYQGSLVTKTIALNGHVQFHFDEDLLTNGPYR